MEGTSTQYRYSGGTLEEYSAQYSQSFSFDNIGNITRKTSWGSMTNNVRKGAELTYDLAYVYDENYGHRARQIGDLHYRYDENGNLIRERAASSETGESRKAQYENNVYSTDYAFALTETGPDREVYEREYTWDYRNQLMRSKDNRYTVRYRYGLDGERAVKYTEESRNETLYYNRMWQMRMTAADRRWLGSKHIFVGETRVATKSGYEEERNLGFETEHQYMKYLLMAFFVVSFISCGQKQVPAKGRNIETAGLSTQSVQAIDNTTSDVPGSAGASNQSVEKPVFPSTAETTIVLRESGFPQEVDAAKVAEKFGYISVRFEYNEGIEDIGKVVNELTFFRHDSGEPKIIGRVTKQGIINEGEEEYMYPNGFSPDTNLVKNDFVGFTERCMKDPFLMYGIAFNHQIGFYITETLMTITIDTERERLALFDFSKYFD